MSETLPEPMVPPGIDLSGFEFMPLYIGRLQRSKAWLACKRNPALGFYLLNLWMRAWQESPAASLDDDDDLLSDAAMCDLRQWQRVRAQALRGWVKCSDGRLYHPVISELAQEAWQQRQAYRERTARARQAKAQRRDRSETDGAVTSVTASVTESVTESATATVTALKGREGKVKGQGEGQGQEKKERKKDTASASPPPDEGFAFMGDVIRLSRRDFDRWAATFYAVTDLTAELRAADAYYAENPIEGGKWFFAVSNWLKRAHEREVSKISAEKDAEDAIYRGVL